MNCTGKNTLISIDKTHKKNKEGEDGSRHVVGHFTLATLYNRELASVAQATLSAIPPRQHVENDQSARDYRECSLKRALTAADRRLVASNA